MTLDDAVSATTRRLAAVVHEYDLGLRTFACAEDDLRIIEQDVRDQYGEAAGRHVLEYAYIRILATRTPL